MSISNDQYDVIVALLQKAKQLKNDVNDYIKYVDDNNLDTLFENSYIENSLETIITELQDSVNAIIDNDDEE